MERVDSKHFAEVNVNVHWSLYIDRTEIIQRSHRNRTDIVQRSYRDHTKVA